MGEVPHLNHRLIDKFMLSLYVNVQGETYQRRFNQLKGQVKTLLLNERRDSLEQLELIDVLQRLGISYHFENEIKDRLARISNKLHEKGGKKNSLYATSLEFRLLRQHQFDISEGSYERVYYYTNNIYIHTQPLNNFNKFFFFPNYGQRFSMPSKMRWEISKHAFMKIQMECYLYMKLHSYQPKGKLL